MKKGIKKKKKEKAVVHAVYYRDAEKGTAERKPEETESQTALGITKVVVKKAAWLFWHLFLFAMAGATATVLLDDSARRTLFELLSL